MRYAQYLTIIVFPLTLLGMVVLLLSFQFGWFQSQFQQLGVYQIVPVERVDEQTTNLLHYLQTGRALDKSYYTQREYMHLQDVRGLIFVLQTITGLLVMLTILIWSQSQSKNVFKLARNAGIFSSLVYVSLGLGIWLFFEQLFLRFHNLAFSNNLWLLDPRTEFLIVIFPPELFSSLALRIIIYSLVISLGFALIGWLARKRQIKRK